MRSRYRRKDNAVGAYALLASKCVHEQRGLFQMRPKLHGLQELVHFACTERSLASDEFETLDLEAPHIT